VGEERGGVVWGEGATVPKEEKAVWFWERGTGDDRVKKGGREGRCGFGRGGQAMTEKGEQGG